MDEIERAMVLPRDAEPLESYGRNYAFLDTRTVIATYLIPSPVHDLEGCEVMTGDFDSRPCTKEELEEIAKSDANSVAAQPAAGTRRWHEDYHSLPSINDGGCTQINIKYDVVARQFKSIDCNGTA